MKIRQIILITIILIFVTSCASNPTPQSTQTESISTKTSKPIETKTPSATATLEPSILEGYIHVFAYADGQNIIFLDEKANRISTIVSTSGNIQDFKVSPDNNWVIYSSSDGTKVYLVIQKIGIRQEIKIDFPHQSKNIIYFNWLSNFEFVLLTDNGYFIGSLDGSKSQVNGNISLSPNSRYSVIQSPASNDLLLYQYIVADGKITGCVVYFLANNAGEVTELIREGNYCQFEESINWSPDGKFVGINYLESTGSYFYTTYIYDVAFGNLVHANEEEALYPYREISWSPDGAFFSFIRKTFTVVIQKNNLESGEIVLEQDFGTPPLQKFFWSPNGRYLLYGRAPNYMYVFDTYEKEYIKVPLYNIPNIDDYASYWWSSNSDGVFIVSGEGGKLGGIYWYSIETKQIEKIGDLMKYPPKPYLPSVIIRQSKDNSYSAIYTVSRNEDETTSFNYFILDEENLQVSSAIKVNSPIYPPPFIWIK